MPVRPSRLHDDIVLINRGLVGFRQQPFVACNAEASESAGSFPPWSSYQAPASTSRMDFAQPDMTFSHP